MCSLVQTNLSQGGVDMMGEGWAGWAGVGGTTVQVRVRQRRCQQNFAVTCCTLQWHPELNISLAYVPTYVDWDQGGARANTLKEAVVRCVREAGDKIKGGN